MESLFWHLAHRTAETQFIFNLFHLLLAGLTLLVLLHQLRATRADAPQTSDRFLPIGFSLLVLHFSVLTLYFGAAFFFRKELAWAGFEPVSHGLMVWGLLVVVAAYLKAWRQEDTHLVRLTLGGCAIVGAVLVTDVLLSFAQVASAQRLHSGAILIIDLLGLVGVGLGMRALLGSGWEGRRAGLVALASVAAALLLHGAPPFLPRETGVLVWNAEQHLLSVSFLAFAWAAGERSGNLLDRVFVRLNLTFILLASLIMLITAGMEKYQYLRLAEERSMNLAEFIRGHVVYYQARGDSPQDIFRHPQVLRRVVVEFGMLPELRQVNLYLDGQRVSFRYTRDWEIKEEIAPLAGLGSPDAAAELENSFQMIRLPIQSRTDPSNRIELIGTMDYINAYIGKYIILIYSLFTIMVGLATGIIGIIVADTDRRFRRQYAELQQTHLQLGQAAKLASVGQLAGGMAHEINNPITSILSLASHLAEEKSAATLTPRQRKSFEVIAQQAERVSKIVGNLLTFSRQSHLQLSQVDVSEVLATAITLVQYRLRENAFRLRREIDADLPLILGDAGRLAEVFVNLLNNAIDAMPSGGTLVIRASPNLEAGGGVHVEVTDTGCGIPAALLPRIFDPFFTTKEPGRGTGLGLSVSHGIIKDHGGQIWAQSRPGAGTTLEVTLPKRGESR